MTEESKKEEVFRDSKREPRIGSLQFRTGLTNLGQWRSECPCGWRTPGFPRDVVLAMVMRDHIRQHLRIAHSPNEYPADY